MTPMLAVTTCLLKCATFSGRASRAEFWWFMPVWFCGNLAAFAFVGWLQFRLPINLTTIILWKTLKAACFAGLLLPISVAARRHHDLGLPAILPMLTGVTALALVGFSFAFAPLLLGAPTEIFWLLLPYQSDVLLAFAGLLFLSAIVAVFPSSPKANRYGPPASGRNTQEVPQ